MNRKGSASLIILIVLIIITLGLGAGAFYLYQQEHAKNIQLQVQIDELNTRQRITEGKLEDAKKLAAEFQLKVEESKAQIVVLTNDLAQEKLNRSEILSRVDLINADLDQQKALRQDLEDRLTQSEADGKKIKDQIKIITQEKKELEAKMKNLEAGASAVELGMVVINQDKSAAQDKAPAYEITKEPARVEKKTETPPGKPLEGKISVVNKEYNFAVINLGSKNGVKLADEFTVSRSNKVVGKLKVEKVHEAMSAAGFAPELKDSIRENDVVQKVQ